MTADTASLPDPVPLGVAGTATLSRARYIAAVGELAGQNQQLLVGDSERMVYIAGRLSEAMTRPLTHPGSEMLAQVVLQRFSESPLPMFAEKALETLRDGCRHDRTAISTTQPHCAVMFVAWYGTHREVQADRYGAYLESLASAAMGIVKRGIPLAGFMEIDAYLRDSPDLSEPWRPLDDVFAIDVEFSLLPGTALGFPEELENPLPRVMLVNESLCRPDENQMLRKLMA
jgi:hypothetical protein